MRVMLFECRPRSNRWGLLLPLEVGAPEWRGVEVRALAVYPREAEGVEALHALEAVLLQAADPLNVASP